MAEAADIVERCGTPATREDCPITSSGGLLDVVRERKAQALAESHRLRTEARAEQQPIAPGLITGWCLDATCPLCGHVLTHIADGAPAGIRSNALARCSGCDTELLIEMTLTPAHTKRRRGTRRDAA